MGGFASAALSRDGRRLLTGDFHGSTAYLWDAGSGALLRRFTSPDAKVTGVAFSADGRWVFTASWDSRTRVWDAETGAERCSLIGFRDGTWAVVDPDGRYDASHDGHVEGLHWVLGDEVISLEQLQSAYYEPGLLAKILEGKPLLQVPDFARIGLFPVALATAPTAADPRLKIDLENRGGGIGRVVVKIDGTAIATDVRGGGADPAAARAHVDVDLAHHPLLTPGRESTITVEAFNADGSLRSRGIEVRWTPPGDAETAPPELWAVVCGISDYHGEALDLRYAAADALAFGAALAASAEGLFGAGHVHVATLATEGGATAPTRAHLEAALEAARAARRDDVFVLYLSGHGVTAGTPPDYCYLTQEASSTDLALAEVRATRAVTAAALEEWLRWIPARKKVLVFDTCRAGEAAKRLGDRGPDAGDQKRALARVRQALGTYTLAGCAADRVSYEASRYGQGLLTYALLEGMKIGAKEATREGDLLEAMGLLSYAMRRVPELARGVGGLQEPQPSVPDLATPIDLGRLTAVTKERIRLAGERPLFVKPAFDLATRPGDPLGLTTQVAAALRTATDEQGQGRVAFVEVDSGEGALRLAGRYAADGARVTVHAYLTRSTAAGDEDVGELDLEGTRDALPALARGLVERALALLRPR